jgi:serine/threonine-protein kinase
MARSNLAYIEEVFHVALSCEVEERQAYLDRVCLGDAVMRHEVESLVAAYGSSDGLLDQTGVTLAMNIMGSREDESMAGQQVGFYQIIRSLGHGGMGAVYLAEDLRLNRKVALKFLSSDFISDSWAKRQLIKEAQAVAMLDHPNICAVYGFEETGEHSFIVMQYIEGETLSELIRHGLTSNQLVALAQQIVSALGNAHAHGIIHRDVKPKNIMVTPSGQVKVLDFGLAKTTPKTLEEVTESISELARDGLLVGTVAYMSPEQLRRENLDYRSDIFSVGTVLYEMASGKNPYAHQTNAEVISAIMSSEPRSLRQIAVNCPRGLERIVDRCLQKDRADRFQSAAELLIDLENVQRGSALATPIHRYLNVRYAALAALSLLVLAVATFIFRAWMAPQHTLALMSISCDDGIDPKQCTELSSGLFATLSRRPGLRVLPSNEVPAIFGRNAASPLKVGRDLGAEMVMFGKVSRGQKDLLLTLVIEKVANGQRIDREYVFNPEKVALLPERASIEAAFDLRLPTNEQDKVLKELIAASDYRSPDAYTLYLQGRKKWTMRDGENIKAAIEDFLHATELDPRYAEAYAGIAECYVLLPTVANGKMSLTTKEAMIKADWAAKQALMYGDNLAESHNAYGIVLLKGAWDWDGAERQFQKAIALNPDFQPAHLNYSNLLRVTGRTQEALRESEQAMNQEPFSGAAIMNHCRAEYAARQFDQANSCLDRLAIDLPDFAGGKYMHGLVYNALGRTSEAIKIFEEIYARDPAYGGAVLGYTYAIAGRRADAERILNEMLEYQKKNYLPDQEIGIIYLGMNDMEHAFPLLRKSVEERFQAAQSFFFSPTFERLRADPRFAELANEVKLPAAASSAAVSGK